MNYRPDIDGLRALAVLPVIFVHAGFNIFSGGFVGVDIFFVISGYLITNILLKELESDKFSIINFYDRRARRILPALFAVLLFCLVLGYFTMMPDEFKNLGQSFVATTFFSNNILLALTSGYWELASEYKPLLHTWSLGVEEQYYIIIPLLLLFTWKFLNKNILLVMSLVFLSSLLFAIWFVNISPNKAFYILPTRAWEIALGGIVAVLLKKYTFNFNYKFSNLMSLIGFLLIIYSIFNFDSSVLSPSHYLLIPTVGACLIIVFSNEKNLVYKILSYKPIVFIGLLSYSLYLWHQPIFSFARIYSKQSPSLSIFTLLTVLVFIISYFSWKYIETPFRNKKFFNTKKIFVLSAVISTFFVSVGIFLNNSYGLPNRVFNANVKVSEMDKRIYNERIRSYSKSQFNSDSKQKILIIGNSFARDFTNLTLETFDTSNTEIIYTSKNSIECIDDDIDQANLYSKANIIVYASDTEYSKKCITKNIEYANQFNKKIYYIGTKHFGHNLNWLARISSDERKNQYNIIDDSVINLDKKMSEIIPNENYISLLSPVLNSNKIPITDNSGNMLSTDRTHLTKYGAIYFGEKVVKQTSYAQLFN